MATTITTTFIEAARSYAELVHRVSPTGWDGPGLGEWDLRALVGHASRSLSTVITYLQRPAAAVDVPSAAAYLGRAMAAVGADSAAVAERGRQAGLSLGADPAAAVDALVDEAIASLDGAADDPVIETIAGGMRLSDYLPTRTFELTVHSLDIAAACRIPFTPPAQALQDAVHLSAAMAVHRGDGVPLLLALTGRKPLPGDFSVA